MQTDGARIRQRLHDLDRTEAWLSRTIGVDSSLVWRWLRGQRPLRERWRREIALALGMQADWLAPAATQDDAAKAA